MSIRLYMMIVLLFSASSVIAQPDHARECVILLHGLARAADSMNKIATALDEQGYVVWSRDYPSTDLNIETLASQTIKKGRLFCNDKHADSIHFVTHSLGGILVRQYLQNNVMPKLGKIIMLAPPNSGSEIADMLLDSYWYKELMGPAGQQLGTSANGFTAHLKPISGVIGIIIGNESSDPWFSPYIPGQDDGKVSIESAKLSEMADFLIVDAGHTFVMRDYVVIQQILYFLEHGQFADAIAEEQGWVDRFLKAFFEE